MSGGNLVSFHIAKGLYGGAMGHHIDRTPGMEHTYEGADKSRRHLNQELSKWKTEKDMKMFEAVNEIIDNRPEIKKWELEGGKKPPAVRKDAVRYLDIHMGGSHERMKEIEKEGKINDWFKDSYEFACEEFGEENIVRFTLHLDEKSPHIHCITVPITKDKGSLSAKKVMGNRINLIGYQDRYAEKMQKYGLVRGKRGSLAVHDGKAEYENRLRLAELEADKIIKKGMFGGVDKGKTIDELKKALTVALADNMKMKKQLDDSRVKIEKKEKDIRNRLSYAKFELDKDRFELDKKGREYKERIQSLENDIEKFNKVIQRLVNGDDELKMRILKILEQQEKRDPNLDQDQNRSRGGFKM